MTRLFPLAAVVPLALALSACHKDDVTVRGTLAGVDASGDSARLGVWAVEAGREAPVQGGAFELADLAPGPVTLELRAGGKTVGSLAIPALPAGTELTLDGLRVDAASGRAFPAAVEVTGDRVVTLNGVRMGPASALPAEVDATGAVLAVSDDDGALLLRPSGDELPDLRVVVTPATQTFGPGGGAVAAFRVSRGDTVRVQGRTDRGYVLAARLTVPQRALVLVGEQASAGAAAQEARRPAWGASAREAAMRFASYRPVK